MGKESLESVEARIRVSLASQNYHQALELLAEAYLEPVFRYCFQMLHGEKEQAEEITQRVFEAACRTIATFRADSSIKTWLFAIAHKMAMSDMSVQKRRDILHRTNVQVIRHQGHVDPTQGLEEGLESWQELTQMRTALSELASIKRSIVLMRFGIGVSHEFSVAEIATVLGKSRDTIYRTLHDGLARLKTALSTCVLILLDCYLI